MQVILKLYATLSDYLPPGTRDNRVTVDVAADESLAQLIARYQLPERLVHLVLVNGVYVAPEDRGQRYLQPDDQVAIWPPIAGG